MSSVYTENLNCRLIHTHRNVCAELPNKHMYGRASDEWLSELIFMFCGIKWIYSDISCEFHLLLWLFQITDYTIYVLRCEADSSRQCHTLYGINARKCIVHRTHCVESMPAHAYRRICTVYFELICECDKDVCVFMLCVHVERVTLDQHTEPFIYLLIINQQMYLIYSLRLNAGDTCELCVLLSFV